MVVSAMLHPDSSSWLVFPTRNLDVTLGSSSGIGRGFQVAWRRGHSDAGFKWHWTGSGLGVRIPEQTGAEVTRRTVRRESGMLHRSGVFSERG